MYFEFSRSHFAQVSHFGQEIGSGILAYVQSQVDSEVDELLQEGETQVANAVDAAQAGGISPVLWVALGVIFIVLAMLVILGRVIRNRQLDVASSADAPLFEDQFAVQDDDIEIVEENEFATAYQADEVAYASEANEFFEDVPVEAQDGGEDPEAVTIEEEASVRIETIVDPGFDNDKTDVAEVAEDDSPEIEDDVKNIISFKEHTDQHEDANTAPANDWPESSEQASVADQADAATEEQEAIVESDEEKARVSYAYASSTRSPIAFSDIADDGDQSDQVEEPEATDAGEEEPFPKARPYIAPTVLREEVEKLEQHQASKIDNLRTEMTRQINTMKSESNNRLDLIINALDRKIDSLALAAKDDRPLAPPAPAQPSPEMVQMLSSVQSALENQGQRIRAITQILDDRLDSVAHVYGEVRNISERIEQFDQKFQQMEQSIRDRANQDVMADVQLSDVVRSSLAPTDYEFKALLSNNNRADCLIKLPHPPGAIVVDTRFPLDAFNALPSREDMSGGTAQAKAAEDSFRRSVLRHIIDVAERYIIPGETADSALLFLPTEAIYTTIHARFPDLVRDSFRARVWIVSPATLMGTLQTLRGVLRDNQDREHAEVVKREAQEVMSEMEGLRSRASMLAQNFEKTQHELRDLLDATNHVMSRSQQAPKPSAPPHSALMEQLYDNKPEWPGTPADQGRSKPRSPSLYDDNNNWPDNLR